MNTYRLAIPHLPPGLNGRSGLIRMTWRQRSRLGKAWTLYLTQAKAAAQGEVPPLPVKVVMTRYYCRCAMDLDNACASLKLPLDALRHAGVLPDDDPSTVASIEVKQWKVAHEKEEGIVLELWPTVPAKKPRASRAK